MQYVLRTLTFLRLLDADNNLSITNIFMMAVASVLVYKIATSTNYQLDIAGIITAVTNYLGKKVIQGNQ